LILRGACQAMATRFEFALEGEDARQLRAALDEASLEIERWDQRLSRFRRDSWLGHLQRHGVGRPVRLEPELFELFQWAEVARRATDGAFDLCHLRGGGLELDAAERTVTLEFPGQELDLGAVGKGFALDRVAEGLRAVGVDRALLHGGTSTVLVLGTPSEGPGFQVGIAEQGRHTLLRLCDEALSVSAQSGRRLADGSGHVRDARRGDAAPSERKVAVRAPRATLADLWSTALLVAPHCAGAAARFGVRPVELH
jgi:thiamine biosynthesis lipoprotein